MPLLFETSEDLHAGLQSVLVPPILFSGRFVEAFGRTIPKDEVGGDLADLVSHGQDVIAYVMDVSGHGLRAGMLMGMAKAAFRYGLLLGQPLQKLVHDINSLLGSLKERNMYVTLAALKFSGGNEVEYISAGHLPLLHYQRGTGSVLRHSMSQFPLGLFPDADYSSERFTCEAGDIFALVTDGIVEIGEDPDAENGLECLAGTLHRFSGCDLQHVAESMFAAATEGDAQQDDATVLLLRFGDRELEDGRDCDRDLARAETIWSKLLDKLAEALSNE